ncbi:mycothione reductase [Gordonia jinhuaensis]|uniref:Pyridine nucleotide-disulphide oxidoreductase family protein n=1 Tax=Gordonia jinhuaensis TaxID=1517702 RepID=A0A916T1L4_9ACTN|nr:mycothione reductase [Gordonia jinhuaensis]GGB26897.1 pyridine nucleotide-disulphide oxidoreductase family protein [Gordonia jinhuaensis]
MTRSTPPTDSTPDQTTASQSTATPSTATHTVDLAIIGSGSGNSLPDNRFDDMSIAIFERGTYGGTCLNVGCIPTKMFVYAAEVAENVREAQRFGIDAHIDGVRWRDIVGRVFGRIDPISAGGERYRVQDCPNITVYPSMVTFAGRTDDGYVLTTRGGDTVIARQVVIAAGSRPVIPEIVESSGVIFHTNDDIMRLAELPEHLIILGSGYIAAEFAHIFSALGSRVSIVARSGALLRALDENVSRRFTEIASSRFDVHLNAPVTDIEQLDNGRVALRLADQTILDGDALLVATGRVANGDLLNLASIGLEPDGIGRVPVDEYGRTPAPGVWALGDVSSEYQLKHVANHEARVVQANLLRGWDSDELVAMDHRFVPAAVFTHPQIATVGLTEAQALDHGIDITVKTQAYADVAYGWAMEDTTGFVKLIADRKTKQLVGAHIIGPQAPTVIQPVIQAMSFGLTVPDMARGQYWIHPAMPEVLENALLGLEF